MGGMFGTNWNGDFPNELRVGISSMDLAPHGGYSVSPGTPPEIQEV
jgi:hypothetical protein